MRTVTRVKWLRFPLTNVDVNCGRNEVKNVDSMKGTSYYYIIYANYVIDFAIEGLHFYCETYDVTRSFPSFCDVTRPDDEFIWNNWVAGRFESVC